MTQQEPNKEFAKLIKQLWQTIKGREGKSIHLIKDELLFEMEERKLLSARGGSNPLDYWGRGFVPRYPRIVYYLADVGINRAKLPLTWRDEFLKSARIPKNFIEPILDDSQQKIWTNLPQPDYVRFVGRRDEIKQLQRLLEPTHRAWVITIDGIGGIGKSALALEIAHRFRRDYASLSEVRQFNVIIWVSAKPAILTGDGIKARPERTRNLEDVYTTIADVLEREDITRANERERKSLIHQALKKQRALLVIDNLESIDDERLISWIREVTQPTKVIVTSRHRIDVAYGVRLKSMSEDEALQLIANETEEREILVSEEDSRRIYKHTGGVPLAIIWSIAKIGFGYSIEGVIYRLGQQSNDVTLFCFEEVIKLIQDKYAYKLLLTLIFFKVDASREALGYITQLQQLDRDNGLADLEKLSLINKVENRFSLLPLTRGYLLPKTKKIPGLEDEIYEGIYDYYKMLITPPVQKRLGDPYWNGLTYYPEVSQLKDEWNNLRYIIMHVLEAQRYHVALDLFLPLVHTLYNWGLWDERVEISREVCIAARYLNDASEAWLWIDAIAYVLQRRGDFQECGEAIEKGRVLAKKHKLDDALILADVNEAYSYARMSMIESAWKKVNSAIEAMNLDIVLNDNAPQLRLRQAIARRATAAAALLSRAQEEYSFEKEWLLKELQLRRAVGESLVPTLSALGGVCLRAKDIDSAEKFLLEASTVEDKNNKDLPWLNYRLALLAEQKEEWKKAYDLAFLAKEGFSRFSSLRVEMCKDLIGRLPKYI